MKVTLTTERGDVFPLDVSLELTVGDLKALVEMEVEGLSRPDTMQLLYNMQPMNDLNKTLGEYGVQENDVIMIVEQEARPQPPSIQGPSSGQSLPTIDWSSITVPGATPTPRPSVDPDNPDAVRRELLSNPYATATLLQRNPSLHEALMNPNPQVFRDMYRQHVQRLRDVERDRIRMINADPFDLEAQARIAQEIQQKNIEENMSAAIEYTPESFSRVVMLYVRVKVNGVEVKALVDSGARATIMSERCAERCNIMRLVDRRFAGVAIGVGRQTIIGKVHLGQIQLGEVFLTSSFQVLKDQSEDMLLGLDMLRRHQCCIDLKDDVLRVGTTETFVPFLKESDLKEKEEMEKQQALAGMSDEDAEMAEAIARSSKDTAGPSTAGPSTQTPNFPEESIQKIISAGFSREDAVQALEQYNGDVQKALISLAAKSLTF